jgi:hypothetical protein
MEIQRDDLAQYARLFVGRRNDYALQREDGRYRRAFERLTLDALSSHLAGQRTLATYVIDETGCCKFVVYDCDLDNGLEVLAGVQLLLANDGIGSYLERSRRGGHLWVLLAQVTRASTVRAWLLPYCPGEVEFYPKQNEGAGVGSLIRLPLGVHRLSGQRYPFVSYQNGAIAPTAATLYKTLTWLQTVERVQVPQTIISEPPRDQVDRGAHMLPNKSPAYRPVTGYSSIREWTEDQDPLMIISRYVKLNGSGLGCCPFGEHHSDGKDSNPSFRAYKPSYRGASSWYCYAWQRGGNVFDFLCLYHGLDAAAMWARIQNGDIW